MEITFHNHLIFIKCKCIYYYILYTYYIHIKYILYIIYIIIY